MAIDKTYNIGGAHAPKQVRTADREGHDFFPTPEWCTRALLDCEKFEGDIWEPACGSGRMSRVLEAAGHTVLSTDLYDRGYGEGGVDFTQSIIRCDNIITNPPYNSAEGFIKAGLRCAQHKLALLLRLSFLESVGRYERIYKNHAPTHVWIFTQRPSFYADDKDHHEDELIKGGGINAYGWFIWDKTKSYNNVTRLHWIPPVHKPKAKRKK
jgi:hypothetical protein